jgi:hypothetical protein
MSFDGTALLYRMSVIIVNKDISSMKAWIIRMQWYVSSVSRGSLYGNFGNKCVKILKAWRTELSYAQNKNRGKKMPLLGLDTCPRLNDI